KGTVASVAINALFCGNDCSPTFSGWLFTGFAYVINGCSLVGVQSCDVTDLRASPD
ncbi:hypothetical protein J6590_090903, partial [Homalodisca vitripennis]